MNSRIIIILLSAGLILSGCKVLDSNKMFETPDDYPFTEVSTSDSIKEFKFEVNDEFSFSLFSNNGFKAVDININGGANAAGGGGGGVLQNYTIDVYGNTKLPLVGVVKLIGLTQKQVEDTLEQLYGEFYIKPFVLLRVTSRKVIFFNNGEAGARIIPLTGSSITLIEGLAAAGGISVIGKAYRIKVLRGDSRNPKVYKIDFSTIDGYRKGNIKLQTNDIVYVESRPQYARELRNEIFPYISLLSTTILTINTINRIK
jgi:polysaccharide export outer membrane protein